MRLIPTVCDLIDYFLCSIDDIFGEVGTKRGVGLLHFVDICFFSEEIEFSLVVDVVCRSKYCRGSSLDINIFGGEGEGLKNQRGDAIDGVPHMG